MKKGKLITIGGAIVVLALCGYFFMGTSSKGKISFQTEKVTRNSMTDVVVATGTVEPVTKVDVGTQVSGIIDRIYVYEGNRIEIIFKYQNEYRAAAAYIEQYMERQATRAPLMVKEAV